MNEAQTKLPTDAGSLQRVVMRLLEEKKRQTLEIVALRKAARIRKADVLLCQLRSHIEAAYKEKHGMALSYEAGWAWEMSAFIKNHFDELHQKPHNS